MCLYENFTSKQPEKLHKISNQVGVFFLLQSFLKITHFSSDQCHFGFQVHKCFPFTSTAKTEWEWVFSFPPVAPVPMTFWTRKRFLALSPHPALEIGVVWMQRQLATAFYCCQLVLCIMLLPLSCTSSNSLSLPVPLINVYKIPGYDSSQFLPY